MRYYVLWKDHACSFQVHGDERIPEGTNIDANDGGGNLRVSIRRYRPRLDNLIDNSIEVATEDVSSERHAIRRHAGDRYTTGQRTTLATGLL